MRELAEGHAAWGLPIFGIGEFLRVVRTLEDHCPDPAVAWKRCVRSMRSRAARAPGSCSPGRRFVPLLRGLVLDADAKGNLVFDAQVAAVCLEHGATTILTQDRDYHRFPGITVRGIV